MSTSRANFEHTETWRILCILYELSAQPLTLPDVPVKCLRIFSQIGFLTEWQMYAQKIEGDSWKGEKLDKGKIDKMSGKGCLGN